MIFPLHIWKVHARFLSPTEDTGEAIVPVYETNNQYITGLEVDSRRGLIYFSDSTDGEVKMRDISTGKGLTKSEHMYVLSMLWMNLETVYTQVKL